MSPEKEDLQTLSRKLAKFDDSIQGVAIIDNQGVVLAQFPRKYKIDEDIRRDFGSIVATGTRDQPARGPICRGGETLDEFVRQRLSTAVIPIAGTDFSVALLCLKSTNIPYLAERIRAYVGQTLKVE